MSLSNGLQFGVLPLNDKEISIKDDEQSEWPRKVLIRKAANLNLDFTCAEFASALDEQDELSHFRSLFNVPKMRDVPNVVVELIENEDDECLYFNGGSLGLMPKSAEEYIRRTTDLWAKWASFGYFHGKNPIVKCDQLGLESTAKILGAKLNEVALMNALTVNIHLLLVSFYRPMPNRHKILVESLAFSSDIYAIKSQIRLHGYDPKESLVVVPEPPGEKTLRPKDILDYINEYGDTIALIFFSGIHYYTGQKFDLKAITKAGHAKGCLVGFDLAHSVGNVKLELHDWNVDFAAWCSYKYLNSGPGGLAGIYVHERHDEDGDSPKLDGWWGNRLETRFAYYKDVDEYIGAQRFKLSNTSPLLACVNRASLDIFEKTTMDKLMAKQFLLTGYLELLVTHHWPSAMTSQRTTNANERSPHVDTDIVAANPGYVSVITPEDPNHRGNQLSLLVGGEAADVHRRLQMRGIACDIMPPDVIRVALAPLYNSFRDVYKFVGHLRATIDDQ